MYKKNTAGSIFFVGRSSSTGLATASLTFTARRTLDAGVQATCTGTVDDLGNGQYRLNAAAGDLNGDQIGFMFTASGGLPESLVIHTYGGNFTDGVRAGLTSLPNAAAEAAGGLITRGTGTGQLTVSAGLVSLAATQTFNFTGDQTGNVTGSVGSVTGAVGSIASGGITTASFAAGAINAAAIAADAIGASELAADAVTEIAAGVLTTALTESYAADGATPTLAQFQYMLWSSLSEFAISSTTITAKKLDGTTTAMTFTMDSATVPTSRTRAS